MSHWERADECSSFLSPLETLAPLLPSITANTGLPAFVIPTSCRASCARVELFGIEFECSRLCKVVHEDTSAKRAVLFLASLWDQPIDPDQTRPHNDGHAASDQPSNWRGPMPFTAAQRATPCRRRPCGFLQRLGPATLSVERRRGNEMSRSLTYCRKKRFFMASILSWNIWRADTSPLRFSKLSQPNAVTMAKATTKLATR